MNKHCKLCEKPRKPRHDRPGKFFTLCDEHYAEYQRQKNRESYDRHKVDRVERSRRYREAHPQAAAEAYQRWIAKPENKRTKQKYMETYRRPWREHVKDACERCGFEA